MASRADALPCLEEWLKSIDMHEYLNNLVSDGWDCTSSLLLLTESDLISIGVCKAGHRKRLFHEINKLRGPQQEPPQETSEKSKFKEQVLNTLLTGTAYVLSEIFAGYC